MHPKHDDVMNPSERIDQLIAALDDWHGKTLASLRKTILGSVFLLENREKFSIGGHSGSEAT